MTTSAEPQTALVVLEPRDHARFEAERASLIADAERELTDAIASPVEFQAVAAWEERISKFLAVVEPEFDGLTADAHATWKRALKIKAMFVDAPKALKARCRAMLAAYVEKQDRIRRDEERRIAEEERQKEISRQKAEASLLDKQGQPEMAKALRQQPVQAPAVSLPSIVPKVDGLSSREDWYWQPVGGDTPANRKRALALMVRGEYLQFVQWNDAALTSFARQTKGTVKVPGIEFHSRQIIVRR